MFCGCRAAASKTALNHIINGAIFNRRINKQLISARRGEHSEKSEIVIDGITRMFPSQKKIELFARKNYIGWDNWRLEIPDRKVEILSQGEVKEKAEERDGQFSLSI